MYSRACRYVLQLALADTIFLLSIPFNVISERRGGVWIFGEVACKLKSVFLYINYNSSVCFLMVSLSALSLLLLLLFLLLLWNSRSITYDPK